MNYKRLILVISFLACILVTPSVLKAVNMDVEVTGLKAELKSTGTKPFNTEEGKGRDTSPDDQITRTFDEATYDVSFATNNKHATITLENMKPYKASQRDNRSTNSFDVEVTGTIPNVDNSTILEAYWDTSGFAKGDYELSSDKRTIKFYVRGMTVGQLYTKGVVLKVNNSEDGKRIKPHFSAKVVGSLSSIEADADKEIIVTGKPLLNTRIAEGLSSNKVEVDGKSGRLHQFSIEGASRAELKGFSKGIIHPRGPIELEIQFKSQARNITTGTMKDIDLPVRFFHSDYNGGKDTFGKPMGVHTFAEGNTSEVTAGSIEVEDMGNNRFKLIFDDYKIDAPFPVWWWKGSRGEDIPHNYTADYMNLFSRAFEFFIPFYNSSDASYDVYSTVTIESVKYQDSAGIVYTNELTTSDNTNTKHLPEYLPGSYSISSYTEDKPKPYWHSQNSVVQTNETIIIRNHLHLKSGADPYYHPEQMLVFDGRQMELLRILSVYGSYLDQKISLEEDWYGVGTVGETEILNASPDMFDWYETLEEAKNHETDDRKVSAVGFTVNGPISGQGRPNVLSRIRFKVNPNLPEGTRIVSRIYGKLYRDTEKNSPTPMFSKTKYVPSVLDNNGNIVVGTGTPSSHHGGNTMYVTKYTVSSQLEILNKENGKEKTTYSLRDGNVINFKIDGSVQTSSKVKVEDIVTLKGVIPSGLKYVENSATVEPTRISNDSEGNTVLEWDVLPKADNSIDSIRFDVEIPLNTKDRSQFEIKSIADAVGDNRNVELYKTAKKSIQIISDASMQIVKRVNRNEVEMDEGFKYTLAYANNSDKDYGEAVILDILPFTEDFRGSYFSGTYTVEDVKLPSGVTVQATDADPETIPNDPTRVNEVNWMTLDEAGEYITALKFIVPNVKKQTHNEMSYTIQPNNNFKDDIYENNFKASIDGIDLPLISNTVSTEVIGRNIEGTAWFDDNHNGLIDSNEPKLTNIKVKLVIPDGSVIYTTTTSDSSAYYRFEDVSLGEYKVVFEAPKGVDIAKLMPMDNRDGNHVKLIDTTYTTDVINVTRSTKHNVIRNMGVLPAVKISKSIENDVVNLGNVATWNINVSNASAIEGVINEIVVCDEVPVGIEVLESSISEGGVYNRNEHRIEWTLEDIGKDETRKLTFDGRVTSESPSELRNIAMVEPYERYPEATESNPVEIPIIKFEKSSNTPQDSKLKVGAEIDYSITVNNPGNIAAKRINIEDAIPQYTELVGNSISDSGVLTEGKVKWVIDTLNAGESKTVTFKVRVNETPTGIYSYEISNTAKVNNTNTNTITHTVKLPNLVFNKESNISTSQILEEGQELTYRINLENRGFADTEEITVTDEIPQGMTLKEGSINESGTLLDRQVKWVIPNLGEGESKILEFTVTVDNLTGDTLSKVYNNIATVNGTETNEVQHTLQKAKLTYSKSSPTPVNVKEGQEIEYVIRLENIGQGVAKNINVSDVIPQGTTYKEDSANFSGVYNGNKVTWNIPTLPAGESKDLKFKVSVNELLDDEVRKTLTNIAEVNNVETNNVTHNVTKAKLEYSKSVTNIVPGETVLDNQEIEYAIRVANIGAAPKENIVIEDNIPEGTTLVNDSITNNGIHSNGKVTWNIPVLNDGEEVVVKFKVTINTLSDDVTTSTINNIATVNSANTNEVVTPVDTLRKRINKLVSSDVAVIGDRLNYRIEVSNVGSVPLMNVNVTDKLPEDTKIVSDSISNNGSYNNDTRTITWNIDTVEPNTTTTLSFDVLVLDSAVNKTLSNIATVDGLPTNEVLTEVVERGLTGSVWYDANEDGSIDNSEPKLAGISVQLLDSTGREVEGKITATDSNGSYTFANLATGDYKVKFDSPKGTIPTKINLITGDNTNHTDETLISREVTLDKKQGKVPVRNLGVIPALEIEQSVNKDHVMLGDTLTYTLTVRNTSSVNIPVSDFIVKDTIVDGVKIQPKDGLDINGQEVSWRIGELNKDEEVSISFDVVLESNKVKHIKNKAIIPQQENVIQALESNEVDTTVIVARKEVDKTDNVKEGETLAYKIVVENLGETKATNINVSDNVSDKLTVKQGILSRLFSKQTNNLTWEIDNLNSKDTKTLSFDAVVNELSEGIYSDTITNKALVDGNKTNEVTTQIVKPNLEFLKTSDKNVSLKEGDEIEYTITLNNTGTTDSDSIIVTDKIPEGVTLVENSISDSGYVRNNEVTWKIPGIAPKESKKVKFKVSVDTLKEVTSKVISNVAIVNGVKTNKVDNIVTKGKLEFIKNSSVPIEQVLKPGDKIIYNITVNNTGDRAIEDIKVTDNIPKGTTLIDGSIDEEGTLSEDVITWNIKNLDVNETKTLSFEVTVNELPEGTFGTEIVNVAYINDVPTNEVLNIVKVPNLIISKSSSVEEDKILDIGDKIEYTITVQNNGLADKDNVVVKDTVPVNTTLVEVLNDGSVEDDAITWTLDKVPAGETKEVKFEVLVNEFEEESVEITNVASVDGIDTNEVKNIAKRVITPEVDSDGEPAVDEEKPPVEEEKPSVDEEKPPVEEEKPSVEEEKPSVEEEKPPVTDSEEPDVPEPPKQETILDKVPVINQLPTTGTQVLGITVPLLVVGGTVILVNRRK